jgi:hypothetical protein
LRRFSSVKKLIDSRPRSSTRSGFPVDVSRLPPVQLSIFTAWLCLWFNDFLHQRFETRIAVQRIERWIYLDPANVGAVTFLETLFEPPQRFIFIALYTLRRLTSAKNCFGPILLQIRRHDLIRQLLETRITA